MCGLLLAFGLYAQKTEGERSGGEIGPMAKERHATSTILFTGDIMLSRDVARQMRLHDDFLFPFRLIASSTRAADLTIGNLEGPISERGVNQGSIYSFRDDPRTVAGLSFAGFDAMALANNHIFDWGRTALSDTVSILNDDGIRTMGAGRNEEEANAAFVSDVQGTKVAMVSYTDLYPDSFSAHGDVPGISESSEEAMVAAVRGLREKADVVVVAMHWGEEYEIHSNAHQKRIGRMLIDAGADLVVGTHPHVVQEVEHYKNGWIAYSLGNFVFDQNFSNEVKRGAMVRVVLSGGRIRAVDEIPIELNKDYQPQIDVKKIPA